MKCLQFKEDHVLSEKIPDSRQLLLAAGCSALGFERPMAFELHNRCNFLNIFNFRPIESHPDGIRVQTHNSASRQVQCPKRLMMQIKGTLKMCGWFLNTLSLSLSLLSLSLLFWQILNGGIVENKKGIWIAHDCIKHKNHLGTHFMVSRVKVNMQQLPQPVLSWLQCDIFTDIQCWGAGLDLILWVDWIVKVTLCDKWLKTTGLLE